MTCIEDQKAWEREMIAIGVQRYRAIQDKAIKAERYTDTSAGARLLKAYLCQVSDAIVEAHSKKTRSMYLKLTAGMDPDKLAYFTLHNVMASLFRSRPVQGLSMAIGRMVEDELRFSQFEIETPEYYNTIIRDLDKRNSVSYKHRHRVLVNRMEDRDIEWHSWNNETCARVGSVLLSIALGSSDLIEKKRTNNKMYIVPTAEAMEWMQNHNSAMELVLPDRMPTISEPMEWEDWKHGGFYTKKLQSLTKLVKTRSGQQRDIQSELLDTCSMPDVLNSINGMQNTSWQVNTAVVEVIKEVWDRGLNIGMPQSQPYEIPPAPVPADKKRKDFSPDEQEALDAWKVVARTLYALEADRTANLMNVVRVMRLSERMKEHELLWIVYQMDFRGRTYSTTAGLSPQGSDVSKAAIQFGKAETLGERGWYWFRVHGANKYGEDKSSYDERVQWVEDNRTHFCNAGRDPLSYTEVWKGADKPYQFLAWCMEFSLACAESDPTKFKSKLPIALDGSCNGLQHFSAMLCDPIGGRSVNLTPSDKPADIYQDVADVATEELRRIASLPNHEGCVVAQNWLALFEHLSPGKGMSRKLSKKPVMTLPYGSTRQTCTQSVYEWYLEQKEDFFPDNTAFKHSVFMADVLWNSIGEVVVAARSAMSWLQTVGRILAKEDNPLVWYTPLGFPMVQFSSNFERKRVDTKIGGRLQMNLLVEKPGVNGYKAALGSSPNFVHTVDSTHMHMTVAECVRRGITHFAMIHDDYGVHARHVDTLHEVIREQFVKLHSTNLLKDFKEQLEARFDVELPDPPENGELILSEVIGSKYFFG